MGKPLKSNEVNKVYVGMSKEDALKLATEKCEKCGHLIDDHLRDLNSKKKYKCRDCGCEID